MELIHSLAFVTPTTEAVTELAGIVAQTTEFLKEKVEF
jgi:hypothetical protein